MVQNLEGKKIYAFLRIMSGEQEFSERRTVAVYFPEHIGPNYSATNMEKFLHTQGSHLWAQIFLQKTVFILHASTIFNE
jgi:hypothetical protein